MAQMQQIIFILMLLGFGAQAGKLRIFAQEKKYEELQRLIEKMGPMGRYEKLNKQKAGISVFDILDENPDSIEKQLFMEWLAKQPPIVRNDPNEQSSRGRAGASEKLLGADLLRGKNNFALLMQSLELINKEITWHRHHDALPIPANKFNIISQDALLRYSERAKDEIDLPEDKKQPFERYEYIETDKRKIIIISFPTLYEDFMVFIIDLKRPFGGGATGIIYAAQKDKLSIAVKICDIADNTRRKDCNNEVHILSHLNRLNGYVQIGRSYYIFMPHYRGVTLSNLPKDLPEPFRNSIAAQLVAAMRSLHLSHSKEYPEGILHRDGKPANCLVEIENDWPHLVIIDFGCSCKRTKEGNEEKELLGTPDYLAPESFKDKKYNDKSDLYSYGLMMFLTLMPDGIKRYEKYTNNSKSRFCIPDPRDVYRACPEGIAIKKDPMKEQNPWRYMLLDFSRRCMQVNPDSRPNTWEVDDFIIRAASYESDERIPFIKSLAKKPKTLPFRKSSSLSSSQSPSSSPRDSPKKTSSKDLILTKKKNKESSPPKVKKLRSDSRVEERKNTF